MTAKASRRDQLVVCRTAKEGLNLRAGDTLVVVVHQPDGRMVLQKLRTSRQKATRRKRYLNPRPLPDGVLEKIYRRPPPEWDKVESEATSVGRGQLVGRRLEEL